MYREELNFADFSYKVCWWLVCFSSGLVSGWLATIVAKEYTDNWYTTLPLWFITFLIAECLIYFPAILPIYAMGAVIYIAKNTKEVGSRVWHENDNPGPRPYLDLDGGLSDIE